MGHRTALPAKNPMLADLGSGNKLIIYRFKRYFCGLSLCKEKGARSFVGENLKKLDGTVFGYGSV